MKDFKLIFIEEGLKEEELSQFKGGALAGCDTLKTCSFYKGDCGALEKCASYSESTAIIRPGGGIGTVTRPTGIIT